MTYKEAFRLIRSDYQRYAMLSGGGNLKRLLSICAHERGFAYSFWLRLTAVKGPLKPLCWLMHHHLSSKFGIQISTRTPIGEGLYIGHGTGIIINASAKIGKNVTICQFLTIGSTKGNAATIEDNVNIGPSVCLVEDVVIGHGTTIGAGAVVTRSIPANCVAAGVPAKIIKKYNHETELWERVSEK